MHVADSRSATWSLSMTLVAIGGFLAVVGVFLGWWDVGGYRESEIFGRELVQQDTLAGTANWTGLLALAAGVVAGVVAIGALLTGDAGVRGASVPIALAGGMLILASAGLGLVQATEVAQGHVGDPQLIAEGSAAVGLFLSAAGGALAAVGGLVARRESAG
jgi:hypothetical protein